MEWPGYGWWAKRSPEVEDVLFITYGGELTTRDGARGHGSLARNILLKECGQHL